MIKKEEIETESKEVDCCSGCGQCIITDDVAKYTWMYNSNYGYWTMSPVSDTTSVVGFVGASGSLHTSGVDGSSLVVRPVIVLSKSLISNE